MCHETLGTQTFTDATHGIRCRLEFGNPSGRKGVPSDYFEGVIEKYDPSTPDAPVEVIPVPCFFFLHTFCPLSLLVSWGVMSTTGLRLIVMTG